MVAARRRTAEDLGVIEEKLVEMERVHLATGTSGPEDLAFHLAIYDATHNPLFRQLLATDARSLRALLGPSFRPPGFRPPLVSVSTANCSTRSSPRTPSWRAEER